MQIDKAFKKYSMKMELFLRDNVMVMINKDKVFKFGDMAQNMREHGKIIWLKGKENSCMLMEISMMDSGRMINQMVLEYTSFKMEISMKEISLIINMKASVK